MDPFFHWESYADLLAIIFPLQKEFFLEKIFLKKWGKQFCYPTFPELLV